MESSFPTSSPLFDLARELRDKIYEDLLTSTTVPISIPLDESNFQINSNLQINFDGAYRDRVLNPPKAFRSSCYGLLYSCRQAYSEILESIERHGGVSFELELTVVGIAPANPAEIWNPLEIIHWSSEVWPTWIVLPLYNYPALFESKPSHRRKCRNFHVSFKVQYDLESRWTMGARGLPYIPNNLFSLLAKFLLHGPSGLAIHSRWMDPSTMWDIDTLSVHITGTGTTYVDPYYNVKLHPVPADAVMRAEIGLAGNMERFCTSGALSGRVRIVKLTGDSGNEREWLIEQGKSPSEIIKKNWAMFGWVIEPVIEDTRHDEGIGNIAADTDRQRHRLFAKLACCHLQ